MLQIIIVDDEPIIREGLKNMPWEQWGCFVAGEAEDGEDGLELVRLIHPDLIITDIRMPGMDGLEFSAHVKEQFPETEIIMLTGYEDFAYAKRAILIGIRELLLKPTKFTELENAVKKLSDEILRKRQSISDYDHLRTQMKIALPLLKNKLVHDLLHGILYTPALIKEKLRSFGITIDKYMVISAQIDDLKLFERAYTNEDRTLFEFAVMNISEETAKSFGKQAIIDFDNSIFTIVLTFDRDEDTKVCQRVCLDMSQEIQKAVKQFLPFTLSIGISNLNQYMEQINKAYLESIEALNHKFFLGDSVIIRFSDISIQVETSYILSENDKQTIINGLRIGNIDEVRSRMDQVKQEINASSKVQVSHLKMSLMELIFSSVRIIGQFNPNSFDKLMNTVDSLSNIEHHMTINELFRECMIVFENIVEIVNQTKQTNLSSSVSQIVELIETVYMEDLSLNMFAERFQLSSAYLSRLIRKETGKTFMEILAEVRMERAISLLNGGTYKVYEVAALVGYKDLSYFIQVFKRRFNKTPNDYKETQ